MTEQMQQRPLYDILTRFFLQKEFRFEPIPNQQAIRTSFKMANGNYNCYAQADESRRTLVFYTLLESKAPAEKRVVLAEFLARANGMLHFGNFTMDFISGAVSYKTLLYMRSCDPTMDMLDAMISTNLGTFDRFFPSMMSVLWSGITAEEAIKKVPGEKTHPPLADR